MMWLDNSNAGTTLCSKDASLFEQCHLQKIAGALHNTGLNTAVRSYLNGQAVSARAINHAACGLQHNSCINIELQSSSLVWSIVYVAGKPPAMQDQEQ